MRIVNLVDLVERGYFWPETITLRAWGHGVGEDDPLQELLLIQELLLSRN